LQLECVDTHRTRHFNVDQKKLPPALRIAAVQAIVALAICASFAIVR
jgi:hypothetical protein